VSDLDRASVATSPADHQQLEALAHAAVERNEVTAVYAFDVVIVDSKPAPTSVRERIRSAHAPTV